MLNAFTVEELTQVLETMKTMPTLARDMTIELRPGQTGGRITRDNNEIVFIPTHREPPRGPYGRD